jgi:uncharacterized protein YebE (UPF0316 family)
MIEFFSEIPVWVSHWIIFPVMIILARMCDVSLGTLRIILVGKGHKNVAPFIGYVEVLIWIFVVSQIIQNLDKVQYYIAFALGHACGTFMGIKIENKLSLGQVIVRVITNHDFAELTNSLKEHNLNFTTMDAEGKFGPVKVVLIIAQRHLLKDTIKVIEAQNQNFFYSIEDVKYVKGTLPGGKKPILSSLNPFKRA